MLKVLAVAVALAAVPTLASADGNAEKGKTVFTQFCATCHGNAGKGDGPAAAALTPKPRDLTDKAYLSGLKDDYLTKVIKNGGTAVGKSALMPPWAASLKDGDVVDVIAHIRGLAK